MYITIITLVVLEISVPWLVEDCIECHYNQQQQQQKHGHESTLSSAECIFFRGVWVWTIWMLKFGKCQNSILNMKIIQIKYSPCCGQRTSKNFQFDLAIKAIKPWPQSTLTCVVQCYIKEINATLCTSGYYFVLSISGGQIPPAPPVALCLVGALQWKIMI